MASQVQVQQMAVFGESGSGKTVLVSSFYGAAQEPSFGAESVYRVLADDTTQGASLRQNYLRMRNEAQTPMTTKFVAKPYAFTVKPKDGGSGRAARTARKSSGGALRLIWHDYPGEWFTDEPSTDEEAARRTETFATLLQSDVAYVLVDGQKLIEYSGEEERYLKSLFWSFCEGLEKLKDSILSEGKRLQQFPRVWVIALSKADLHPDLDVLAFEDMIIQKAAGDVAAFRTVLQGFVELPEALSLGEDFMLLSSAQFEAGRIEMTKRVGLDLILPVATLLPLERLAQWIARLDLPLRALEGLAERANVFARVLTVSITPLVAKAVARIPRFGPLLAPLVVPTVTIAVNLGRDKLIDLNRRAVAHKDYLTATVTGFRLDLDRGVQDRVLKKSLWSA